ncbi:MAG: hypothetical protein V3U54_07840 [Thermodesulfobacteriota bacterium]
MSAKNHPDVILQKLREHIQDCHDCKMAVDMDSYSLACGTGQRMRIYLDDAINLNGESDSDTYSFQTEFINVFGFWPSRN